MRVAFAKLLGRPRQASQARRVDRRRVPRQAVELAAQCRTATGRFGYVVITDLTSVGCRLFCRTMPLSKGLEVRLWPETSYSFAGVIRWASRGYAGVEFDKPLPPALAEELERAAGG